METRSLNMCNRYLLIILTVLLSACQSNNSVRKDNYFTPNYESCKDVLINGDESEHFKNKNDNFKEITNAICEQVVEEVEFNARLKARDEAAQKNIIDKK